MRIELIKVEYNAFKKVVTVKYFPGWFLGGIFKKKPYTKQFIEKGTVYWIDNSTVWLNYPSCTEYGRFTELDTLLLQKSLNIN